MIHEYIFERFGEENQYRQFSDEIENNHHVFFHGTAEGNFELIKNQGFQPKPNGNLQRISFAKNSSLALSYACEARSHDTPNSIIIVVDISNIKAESIDGIGGSVIHLSPEVQPAIIGYCLVPQSYQFK